MGLFPRKANLGPLGSAVGFEIAFDEDRTTFTRCNIVGELASRLPLRQRMTHLLRRGAMTIADIAEELGASVDRVTKAAKRGEGK